MAPRKYALSIFHAFSNDYQNDNSRIRQADYYPRGVMSIMELINTKTIRLWSVLEAMENDPNYEPNFEGVEDSLKDLINYSLSQRVSFLLESLTVPILRIVYFLPSKTIPPDPSSKHHSRSPSLTRVE